MDGKRFDDISRLLSRTTGRRSAVKSVLGAILGGGAVVAGLDEASATKPLRGRPYRSTCTADRQCRNPLICRREKSLPRADRNRCGCPEGLVWCAGQCVELGTEDHCLACGDTCASGEFCCAEGNGCTELGTTDNCADCGDACNPDIADVCFDDAYCACGVNGEICDGEFDLCCDGDCTDSMSDENNCGNCGTVCDIACYGGECHGEFDRLTAVLDADGGGWSACDVWDAGTTLSCESNADCGGYVAQCAGPDNRCVCVEEMIYDDSDDNDDWSEFAVGECRVLSLVGPDGECQNG